jgi:hypothetical protein
MRRRRRYVLLHRQVDQARNLVAICAEHVVLAARKVRVHLAGQERVLGDIGVARVFLQREDEQPCDADEDQEGGEVRGNLEDAGVLSERQQRRYSAFLACSLQRGSGYEPNRAIQPAPHPVGGVSERCCALAVDVASTALRSAFAHLRS